MPRSILYVIDSLGLSGKTHALADLALGLDPARYRAVVASLAPPDGVIVDRLRAGGVPVEHVACRDGVDPRVVSQLVRAARKVRPAVVHCFNPRPMLYGGLAAAISARPAIGSLSAFACLPDQPYKFLPQSLHTRSPKNRLRNRVVARLMRRLVAVSPLAAETYRTGNALPATKLAVIGYGVDLDAADRVPPARIARFRAELGVREGELLIGSLGRLVEQKDYETQLRAFAHALAVHGTMHMAIAGAGPLADPLAALARELGIASRVHWLGERDDAWTVLRSLDLFVIASKFEPFGIAVLEAMAAGLPIIASAVNELPQILDGGRAGRLVPAERPPELAAAMVELARDPTLRDRFGRRARERAVIRHGLGSALAAYQALYDEVMEEPR
jgi:glycosyltransferase involved in cell wall biosynthesis